MLSRPAVARLADGEGHITVLDHVLDLLPHLKGVSNLAEETKKKKTRRSF